MSVLERCSQNWSNFKLTIPLWKLFLDFNSDSYMLGWARISSNGILMINFASRFFVLFGFEILCYFFEFGVFVLFLNNLVDGRIFWSFSKSLTSGSMVSTLTESYWWDSLLSSHEFVLFRPEWIWQMEGFWISFKSWCELRLQTCPT